MPNTPVKPVFSIDADGKKTYYPSVGAAAKAISVKPAQISTAIATGRRCHGLYWEKVEK